MKALVSCFFIFHRKVDLENVSPSVRWSLMGVCYHIDCWLQVSCSRLQEFETPNSNAIIWKTKNIFWLFCSLSGIYIKFYTFSNKWLLSQLIFIQNYRLWKSWLDHSLKSALSEHALKGNMWKHPKYFPNLHERAFIMFFHRSQGSWFGKCLP